MKIYIRDAVLTFLLFETDQHTPFGANLSTKGLMLILSKRIYVKIIGAKSLNLKK